MKFARFLHELALKGFLLPVFYRGRLFKVFPLLPFADDALFFHHALETLNGFFEVFSLIQTYMSYTIHPLFVRIRPSLQKNTKMSIWAA